VSGALPFEFTALRGAVKYQRWIVESVTPYLGVRILEVGAGVGIMSRWLPVHERLVLSEAEPALLSALETEARQHFGADPRVAVMQADLSRDLPAAMTAENFDTVVSFNVIEHIEDDVAALARLADMLAHAATRGPRRIVSFVPAHAWAFGAIDAAYGHFRRYSAASFARLVERSCPGARLDTRYFNTFGLPGWLVLGKLLRRRSFSAAAVDAFDRLCPWLRGPDRMLHSVLRLPLGQSLIAVVTLP